MLLHAGRSGIEGIETSRYSGVFPAEKEHGDHHSL